jgi:hypothetical protein
MKLEVKRIAKKETYTIGKMYVDGVYFCDTLEDKVRDLAVVAKVANETAIPAGMYNVTVNRSPKFGRDLPRLENVPQFDGILIHRGNTDADTSGCILVGENKAVGKVLNSTPYELELVKRCKAALAGGGKISITIDNGQ